MVRQCKSDDKSDDPPACPYEFDSPDDGLPVYQPPDLPVYQPPKVDPYAMLAATMVPASPVSPGSLINGRYQLGTTIGKGNDGTVVRGLNVTTGRPVAIKIASQNRQNQECGSSESENTKRAQSRNVVKVHEVLNRGEMEYLVMELAEMDLLDLINALGCVDEDTARGYFRDLIHGLESCHKVNVVHLDVKPDNLLIIDDGTVNGRLKLTDFGLSAYIGGQLSERLSQACGSNGYAPPEILRGNETYDGRCADIWSCGIVLYACTQGQLPWDDACEECEEFLDHLNGDFNFPSDMSPGLKALFEKILVIEPNNRATLEDIQNDEWFRQGHQLSLSDSYSSESDTEMPVENVTAPSNSREFIKRS